MNSCIYQGWVRHRRYAPVENRFRYELFMMYLDLDELPAVFRGNPLWSAGRPALAWFRRADHLGDPDRPLDECVRDLVEAETGSRPGGPIRLLTHLRYFGHCMNPVSVYFCFERDGRRVETIVAEVHNTPWNERHPYVLDTSKDSHAGRRKRFRFRKEFHVSPFLGMEQEYDWRLVDPGRHLAIHMENHEGGQRIHDATLVLRRKPITPGALHRLLLRHPFMTLKVVAAIYRQAFRLWRKRAPFFRHPRHRRMAS